PDFLIDSPSPRLTRRENQELTPRRRAESAAALFAPRRERGPTLIAPAERAGSTRRGDHGHHSDQDDRAAALEQFVVEDPGHARRGALGWPGSTNERLAAYISTHIAYCRAESARAAAIIAAVGYLSRPTAAASQGQPHGSQEPSASQDQSYSQRSADS